MKTFKKIVLGVGLAAFLAATLILIFQNRALAVVPPIQTSGTKNIQTYYDSCVDRILVNSGGGTWCQWFNDKIPDTTMLYGQANAYPVNTITGSNYQYSQGTTSVQGTNVPSRITILNSKNTALGSLGDSNLTPVATTVYTARLSKEGYLAYSPGSGGDNRYVLLVAPQKNNQPPLILALVKKDAVYKDTSGTPNGDGVVYAYKINKEAVASNSDGSANVPSVLKGSSCTDGSDCANGLCQKDNGDCSNNSSSTTHSCSSNFVSPFAWIICPALDLADSVIQSVYGQVEDQLCFNTGNTSSTNGVVCKGQPNSLVDGVKASWNIFKNIASALLVIAMLIMIISQAIGGGLFEAYTIRKMLPKLVAAVILMQLSFVLLKYAIDISNDAGTAIGNIMLAPFGGVDHMNLKDMVGNGVHIATGSSPGQAAFDLFATIAAIGGIVWAIPALPLLALYVIVGVFVAFFVLIIRKLLIIMLVILAPLAFIAWVMPGTDRYWKMWRENLTKLLVMFPLIMAMLSAGRIVAFITSQDGNGASMFVPHLGIAHLGPVPIPYMASATGFADLVIIIGAYFAPYFLLPKTYSWGGQLLGQAGKAVEKLTNRGAEPAKKLLKEREESYRGERRRKSQERFKNDVRFNWKKPWQRPIDLFRAGTIDPTYGVNPNSRRRRLAEIGYMAAGGESEKKDIEAANTAAQLVIERIHPDEKDTYARALAAGQKLRIDQNGRIMAQRDQDGNLTIDALGRIAGAQGDSRGNLLDIRAGLDQVARLGGEGNVEFIQRSFERAMNGRYGVGSTAEQIEMMNKFSTANVQSLFAKLPHIYKNNNYAVQGHPEEHDVVRTVQGLTPADITALSGVGMRTLRDNLMIRANQGDQNSIDALRRLADTFQQTLADGTLRGRIPADVARAMHDLAVGNTPNGAATSFVDPATLANINAHVDDQGVVH